MNAAYFEALFQIILQQLLSGKENGFKTIGIILAKSPR
jgi:hypothetical protein